MAGARGFDVGRGRLDLEFLRLQRGVVLDRGGDPAFGRLLGRQFRLEVLGQALEAAHGLAGEFHQRLVGVLERVAGHDGVGARAVVLGARFVHVGDRREADFEALVGEVELLLQRRLLRFGGGQRFDRDEHVEVGGRCPRRQRVARRFELEVRRPAQRLLALEPREIAAVVDHLSDVDAEPAVGGFAVGVAVPATPSSVRDVAFAVGARAGNAGRAVDLRQHRGAGLHGAFLGGEGSGFGGRQLRIAGARELIGLQQVFGVGARGRQQHQGEGENEGAAAHCGVLGVETGVRI